VWSIIWFVVISAAMLLILLGLNKIPVHTKAKRGPSF
jgi:hypothetical protein